eukprot:1392335-Pleurochrysis_carterae.AAC.1
MAAAAPPVAVPDANDPAAADLSPLAAALAGVAAARALLAIPARTAASAVPSPPIGAVHACDDQTHLAPVSAQTAVSAASAVFCVPAGTGETAETDACQRTS